MPPRRPPTSNKGVDPSLILEALRRGQSSRGGVGCSVPSQPRNLPPGERERRRAESLYETEMIYREHGVSGFVYDEERDTFRFKDGRFAFSRTHANTRLLEERGYKP